MGKFYNWWLFIIIGVCIVGGDILKNNWKTDHQSLNIRFAQVDSKLKALSITNPYLSEKNKASKDIKSTLVHLSAIAENQKTEGLGIIVSKEGYVLTKRDFVINAIELKAELQDNSSPEVVVIASDEKSNLALLKLTGKKYPSIAFQAEVEWIDAAQLIGIGLNENGKIQSDNFEFQRVEEQKNQPALLALKANDNNSILDAGTIIVNQEGHLLGIAADTDWELTTCQDCKSFIDAKSLVRMLHDWVEYGSLQYTYLPLEGFAITEELRTRKNWENDFEGVYVNASKSDIFQKGDVILSVDDQHTPNLTALNQLITEKYPGDKLKMTILRNNQIIHFVTSLNNQSGTPEILKRERKDYLYPLGAEFEIVKRSDQGLLKLTTNRVKINQLYPGKLRQNSSIEKGFIIEKIDGKVVNSLNELTEILVLDRGPKVLEGFYQNELKMHQYVLDL